MSDKVFVGPNVSDLDIGQKPARISRVNILVDSDHAYTAGDDTGRTFEKTVPWGTQAMADAVLAAVKNYDYQPFSGADALIDPAAELGDGITVGGVYSVLMQKDISFGRMTTTDISAPGTDEIEDEYPYKSRAQRQAQRQEALIYSRLFKTAEEIRAEIVNGEEGLSAAWTLKLNEAKTELQDSINGLSAEMSLKYDEFSVSLRDGLSGLSADFDLKLEGLRTTFEDEQKQQTAEFTAGLSGLEASLKDEMAGLSAQLKLDYDEFTTTITDEVNDLSADLTLKYDEFSVSLKNGLDGLSADFDLKLDGLKTTFTDEVNGLSAEFTEGLAGVSSRITSVEEKADQGIASLTEKTTELTQDIDGFKTTVSETYATKSALSEEVKTLNSTISQTAESIESTVSANYATKTALGEEVKDLQSAIEQTAEGIMTQVSATYATQAGLDDTVDELKSTISQTAEGITTEVAKKYATNDALSEEVATLNSTIEQTAEGITTTVSATYATKSALSEEVETLESSISQTADSIKSTVSATYATKDALAEEVETLESSIEQTAKSIKSSVSETYATKTALSTVEQYAKSIKLTVTNSGTTSTLKLMAGSASLSSAEITFTGLVTLKGLEGGTTKINGACIQTGTIEAARLNLKDYSTTSEVETLITTQMNGLTLSVTNGSTSSTLKLMAGKTSISSADIKFTGVVTVDGLSNGTTKIDGGCIQTGTISASRIDVDNLKVTKLFTGTGLTAYTAISTSGTTLNVGGTAWAPSYIEIYGKNSVYIGPTNDTGVKFDMTSKVVTFGSSLSPWTLGSTTYPLNWVYIKNAAFTDSVKLADSTGKIGFFGTTPIARTGITTTSSNMGYSSATANNYLYIINNLVGILQRYGLIAR